MRQVKWSILLTLFSFSACALENIQIESDSAQYFHQESKMVHQGHVVVNWQGRTLHANSLTLYKDKNGGVSHLVAEGTPAVFQGSMKESLSVLNGEAKTIEYQPKTSQLTLRNEAKLHYDKQLFQGPHIAIDLKNNTLHAIKQDSARPTLIFETTVSELKNK